MDRWVIRGTIRCATEYQYIQFYEAAILMSLRHYLQTVPQL